MPDAPLIVLYVAGFGRSGTTLFDNALGQLEGVFSAGELHYVWDRSLLDDRLCGCGERFSVCPVWSEVAARLGDEAREEAARWSAVRESINPRAVAWARLRGRSLGDRPEVAAYARAMERVYRAVGEATGASVVVDSSKSPALGALIDLMPTIEGRALLVIRDPRATAYSWTKTKVYDASGPEPMYMSVHRPAMSAKLWTTWNVGAEIVWRRRLRRLRYEDAMDDPRRGFGQLAAAAGRDGAELPLEGERELRLAPNHAMAGNPSRFRTGAVTLRRDDAWRASFPARDRWLVTLLTLPLLLRYRYPIVVP